jgi:ABC-2 type transport system permease protein
MRPYFILLRKELHGYFVSPVAYIVLALVMVLNGFYLRAALTILESAPSDRSIVTWTFDAKWSWLSYFFIFPLLTMRLFAEEKKLGTMETLMTAPIRTWHIVWAKYSAAVLFYCMLWLPSMSNFWLLSWITGGAVQIPHGPLVGSYAILFTMGLFNLAMGCLASALTANQIIAAITSFTFCLLHFLLSVFMQVGRNIPERYVDAVSYISSSDHIRVFTAGLIDSRPLIYYISLAMLFLAFTHQAVEFRRWRP